MDDDEIASMARKAADTSRDPREYIAVVDDEYGPRIVIGTAACFSQPTVYRNTTQNVLDMSDDELLADVINQ